jgi:ATP-dependent helicase/nuclease subunit A
VLHEHRAALPCVLPPDPPPDLPAFLDAVESAAEALRAELDACTNPDADAGYHQALTLIDWVERLHEQRDDEVEVERRVLFRPPRVRKRAGNKSNWSSDTALAALRTAAESLDEAVEVHAAALRGEVIAEIVPLVEEFVARYAARRRADGLADFDDLLVWARDLLRNPQVRVYFHERYRCVLIDEFQDTDPVQTEIARLLTDVDGDGVPEPGRLVVVGDPKQSIYRFRRADIAIYDEVKFGPLADGQALIQQNFRSVGGLLDWVNRVFADAFGDGERGTQPPHVPLLAVREAPAGQRAPIVVVHGDGQAVHADEIREQEAERLAAVLDQAVRGDPWTVFDRNTRAHRPARWRDCVILLPARTGIDIYIDALAARDIPYRAETRGAFFGTPRGR